MANKRVAITVAAAFLRTNGFKLRFNDLEAYEFLIGLYETKRLRFDELDSWLRAHITAL
jgi:prophage maintenance system killer protein